MNRIGMVLLTLAAFLLGGCDTGVQQRLNCICLIDYSGSLSDRTLHQYVETISSDVLRHMRENDRLVVMPIDEGAKTKAVKLVYEDLSDMTFLYHSDGYAHARDSLNMRLHRFAVKMEPSISVELIHEKALRHQYTYFSDIFAALEQAGQLVERNEAESFWDRVGRFVTGKKKVVSTNVILIFSDMIQESSEASFAGADGVRPEQKLSILDNLRGWHRIPDLHDCLVFVNGRTGANNAQVESIQDFWAGYFNEAGARLCAYDYDAGPQITAFLSQRNLVPE